MEGRTSALLNVSIIAESFWRNRVPCEIHSDFLRQFDEPMNRREALQLLAGGAVLQLQPVELLAAIRKARAVLGTEPVLRTLDSHRDATITAIAEMIIPKTETAGAADIGASKFVDLILTEWCTDEERTRFLNGLADVDQQTQERFGAKFINCSQGHKAEILTNLGEQMAKERELLVERGPRYRGSAPTPENNFYYMLRKLVLNAYYTSEEGAVNELGFQIIPDHYDSCSTVIHNKGRSNNSPS
jgi:gluconate 2-dehydrogenase gamma chain